MGQNTASDVAERDGQNANRRGLETNEILKKQKVSEYFMNNDHEQLMRCDIWDPQVGIRKM